MAAMEIKLMIDPKSNKVIFAEASKDFVDFLIFLLSLPIGAAIKLLTSKSMTGSIGNVYTSVANLDETYLQPNINKNVILNPFVFSSVKDIPLSLNRSRVISSGKFYSCRGINCEKCFTNVPYRASCPDCCSQRSKEIDFSGSYVFETPWVTDKNLEGYVKKEASYMIFDDLSVTLISTMSILSTMDKFSVSKLEERKVKFGSDEALQLLKASLQSTTVLNDVFRKMEDGQGGDFVVSENTSEAVVFHEHVEDDIAEVEEEVTDEAKELEGSRVDDEMADAKEEINDEAKEIEEKRGDDELVELAYEEIKDDAEKVEEKREDDEMAEAKEEIKDEAKGTVVDAESNEQYEDLAESIKENEEMNNGEKEHEADKPLEMKRKEKATEREEDSTVLKKHLEGKGSKKEVTSKKKVEPKTPNPPIFVDRPVRERKSVERLVSVIVTKELRIEKGRGTALKDIPNVAFQLSRRKCDDDTCRLLHTILFGRRGKAAQVKSNISRFSGFVWRNNEKKKIKEKLDKCTKVQLVEFCEILDIVVSNANFANKEEVIVKLMEFLEAPRVTTSELLCEKEHSSKGSKSAGSSSSQSSKSRKRAKTASWEGEEMKENPESSEDNQENVNGLSDKSEESEIESDDDYQAKSQESGSDADSEEEKSKEKHKLEKTPPSTRKSEEECKSQKVKYSDTSSIPKPSPSKTAKRPRDSDITSSAPNDSKKKKSEAVKEKDEEEAFKPSDDQLKVAIRDILKQADFNTTTLADFLKQLAKQFETDLTARESSIKLMIQEELFRMVDEERRCQ